MNLTSFFAITALAVSTVLMPVNNLKKAPAMKQDEGEKLTITSKAFKDGGMIPNKYTCKGSNFNPPLHIEGTPKDAKSLVVIVDDPDAPVDGGFTHWIMWNVDQTMVDIPEAYKGATQGMNMSKKKGYTGPCPPDGTHHYHFKVFALSERLKVASNVDKAGLEKAMEGKILAQGEIIGLFSKNK